MRVLLGPVDEGGRGKYRLIFPGQELARTGDVGVEVDVGLTKMVVAEWDKVFLHDRREANITGVRPLDFDVLVMQLPMTRWMADAIPFIQANGTAVVVEIDDDMWAIPRHAMAHSSYNPALSPHSNYRHLTRACRAADLVTVTTPALAKVINLPEWTVVLRNCVPERYLRVEPDQDKWAMFEGKPVVGWTGSPATHDRGDLEQPRMSVARACRKTGAAFLSLGSNITPSVLGFDDKEAAYAPWVEFDEYPQQIAGLSVGIVPLNDTRFNRCKSWLKGIEYAALGVPFVASPLPEYAELAGLAAGDLAGGASAWERALVRLLKDEGYRSERRGQGKQAAAGLTYESQAWRWAEAWELAIARHRKRRLQTVC